MQTAQAEVGPAPPVADDPKADVHFTPGDGVNPNQAAAGHITPGGPVMQNDGTITEERVEYRDEDGNLLDEEQVRALEGQVSFSTRYETRTRVIDEYGNEVDGEPFAEHYPEGGEGAGQGRDDQELFAGTRADGPDPVTGSEGGEAEANTVPPVQGNVEADLRKDEMVSAAAEATLTPEAEEEIGKQTRDEL